MDIGLPKLNGLNAARRIRELLPSSKIVFLSQEAGAEVVQEAFRIGALGYVLKHRAATELLPALRTTLEDRRFLGTGLACCEFRTAKAPDCVDSFKKISSLESD